MTPQPPPSSPLASARVDALRLLLRMGLLGSLITGRLGSKAEDPDLARNLPIVVLADLAVAGTRRPAEIQQRSGLTSGGVTKLLDRLEAQGLVARAFGQVPGDRRAIVVSLTPKGLETATTFADGLLDNLDEVRAAFDDVQAIIDGIESARAS